MFRLQIITDINTGHFRCCDSGTSSTHEKRLTRQLCYIPFQWFTSAYVFPVDSSYDICKCIFHDFKLNAGTDCIYLNKHEASVTISDSGWYEIRLNGKAGTACCTFLDHVSRAAVLRNCYQGIFNSETEPAGDYITNSKGSIFSMNGFFNVNSRGPDLSGKARNTFMLYGNFSATGYNCTNCQFNIHGGGGRFYCKRGNTVTYSTVSDCLSNILIPVNSVNDEDYMEFSFLNVVDNQYLSWLLGFWDLENEQRCHISHKVYRCSFLRNQINGVGAARFNSARIVECYFNSKAFSSVTVSVGSVNSKAINTKTHLIVSRKCQRPTIEFSGSILSKYLHVVSSILRTTLFLK